MSSEKPSEMTWFRKSEVMRNVTYCLAPLRQALNGHLESQDIRIDLRRNLRVTLE